MHTRYARPVNSHLPPARQSLLIRVRRLSDLQVAAALCASYIGGSLNFAATATALGLPQGGMLSAAMAADNIVMAVRISLLSRNLHMLQIILEVIPKLIESSSICACRCIWLS